jgi:hypothetical protein
MLVLYDVTSTYFEGRTCPLAKLGYSRDWQAAQAADLNSENSKANSRNQ